MTTRASIVTGTLILLGIGMISFFALKDHDESEFTDQDVSGEAVMAPGGTLQSGSSSQIPAANALSSIPIVLPIPEDLTFCGEPVPLDRPEILERFEKELYITAHRYYQVVFYLKRGPRIFPTFRKILEEEGAPEDLIYLSTIESDLIPTIESPVGAKGLWQFMKYTAPRYDLKVNRYIDERMHTEKSTRAAIQYMKKAKEKFGSWTTAAASYNMGMNGIQSVIDDQNTNNYYDMYLNPETSRYVFRILAAKTIIEHPDRYGYAFPKHEYYESEPYKTVQVTNGIQDIPDWATQLGFTYYDVRRLNPWVIGKQLPAGSYKLRIPK